MPNPPSPIASSSLYGPTTVPADSSIGPWTTVVAGVATELSTDSAVDVPACSTASSSAMTCARIEESPSQELARNRVRSSGSAISSASRKILFTVGFHAGMKSDFIRIAGRNEHAQNADVWATSLAAAALQPRKCRESATILPLLYVRRGLARC